MSVNSLSYVVDELRRFDVIVLDQAAQNNFERFLVASKIFNLYGIGDFVPTTNVDKAVAFIVSSPFTKVSLDYMTHLHSKFSNSRTVTVFSSIEAEGNVGPFEKVDESHSSGDLSFISKKYGPYRFIVKFFRSVPRMIFPNIMLLAEPHNISTDLYSNDGAFYELNSLLQENNIIEEIYCLGEMTERVAARFSEFTPTVSRHKTLYNSNDKTSGAVIFIDDLAISDPIACLEPYTKPTHLLDLILAELSSDGRSTRVSLDQLLKCSVNHSSQSSLLHSEKENYVDLLGSTKLEPDPILSKHLMMKEQESLSEIQRSLLQVAERINHDLPELVEPARTRSQWADLLRLQTKELLGPVCASKKFSLLNYLQLAIAASQALYLLVNRSRGGQKSANHDHIDLNSLLSRFERSLIVASQSDAKLLQQLQKPIHCEPILMSTLNSARDLPSLDEAFLFVAYCLNLLPVQYNVPDSIWDAVRDLLQFHRKNRTENVIPKRHKEGLIPDCVGVNHIIKTFKKVKAIRAKLPSYSGVLGSQPRYRSPLVQMIKDLITARANPNEAPSALSGLKHVPCSSVSGNWFGDLSRFVPLSGPSRVNPPYKSDHIILVIMGSLPLSLARDLFDAVKPSLGAKTSDSPFKLHLVANSFTGGRVGISRFLDVANLSTFD